MLRPLEIDGLTIGAGTPAIVVPIVAREPEAVAQAGRQIHAAGADIAEWRVDFLEDWDAIPQTLDQLTEALAGTPLLFTIRTAAEGGGREVDPSEYRSVLQAAAGSGQIDLVDIEYRHPMAALAIATAASYEVPVIASHHNFHETPSDSWLMDRMLEMSETGADICKLAVMPSSASDVARLMGISARLTGMLPVPHITIAMGRLGAVTRLTGQVFGSAAAWASIGSESSAPGQFDIDDVRLGLRLFGDAD